MGVVERLRHSAIYWKTCERYTLNSTQLNEHLWTQVLKHLNVHIYLVTILHIDTIINLFRVLICRRFQSGRPQNHT